MGKLDKPSQIDLTKDAFQEKTWHEIHTTDSWRVFKIISELVEGFEYLFGIDLLEQQHAAVADDVATVECGLDDTPANPPKLNGLISTLWHRQSSVDIGGQIPMTTGSATRLPTYCS